MHHRRAPTGRSSGCLGQGGHCRGHIGGLERAWPLEDSRAAGRGGTHGCPPSTALPLETGYISGCALRALARKSWNSDSRNPMASTHPDPERCPPNHNSGRSTAGARGSRGSGVFWYGKGPGAPLSLASVSPSVQWGPAGFCPVFYETLQRVWLVGAGAGAWQRHPLTGRPSASRVPSAPRCGTAGSSWMG